MARKTTPRVRGRRTPPSGSKAAAPALLRLEVHVSASASDEVAAWLVEAGAGGVEQKETPRAATLVVYGEDERALGALAKAVEARAKREKLRLRASVSAAPRATRDWETRWLDHLEPVELTDSLRVLPTAEPAPPGAEDLSVIRLEPALAFGFGEHPTTRLAACAVEAACRAGARTVLDVGTGSGVLAFVAVLSGAERATGIDVDPRAVAAAQRNAALNGLDAHCRFSRTPASRVRGTFDVVVANVGLAEQLALAPALAARLAPSGTLLLTGFLEEDAVDVGSAYERSGLSFRAAPPVGDWVLLCFTRGRASRAPRAPAATARGTSRTPRSRSAGRRA